ncbi:MAG: MBL fold metallo-hydrolase [bacterium]|nr:MAG: MBL fold metallo-hydrolase [bacterium]
MIRRFSSQFLGMNSAVIYKDGAAHLIDPGVFPREIARIKDFLHQEALEQVTILLTHTHGDHISGWHAFSDFPTYTHESVSIKSQTIRDNDVRYLQGMYRKQGFSEFESLTFPSNLHYVKDGELTQIFPAPFYFYHTAGHSIDMSVIVFPEDKLMISGDMLIHTPLPFILHSIQGYWKSLIKINNLVLKYNVQTLIPGHGKPASTQNDIIDRILHEKRYIQKLVLHGKQCVDENLPENKLKEKLSRCFPELASLHAHQANIQTFIREQDILSVEEFSTL